MSRFLITATAAAFTLAIGAGALAAQALSKEDYKAGKDRIAADYKSAKAACDSLSANAKDVCIAEAKGKEKVAKAELEASNHPGQKTRHDVGIAKAEAEYAVAKEKCDDQAGDAKKACLKDAKSAETRAKADASKPAKAKTAAATSKHESPGAYVDDSVITAKVKAAVLQEPTLKSAEINVETYKGIVQLTGFVSSRASIDKAVEVARGVAGVKSVKNDMIVKGQK